MKSKDTSNPKEIKMQILLIILIVFGTVNLGLNIFSKTTALFDDVAKAKEKKDTTEKEKS